MSKGFTDISQIVNVNLHEINRRVRSAQLEQGKPRRLLLEEAASFAEGLAAILRLEVQMSGKYPELVEDSEY